MKIIVEKEVLVQVVEAIKRLPVKGDFDAADQWVGCVIALQKMMQNATEHIDLPTPEFVQQEEQEESEETKEKESKEKKKKVSPKE